MVGVTFFGNFDLASLAIWSFWIFFAGLIVYIQRENLREGFPLQDDDGTPRPSLGWGPPEDKTFILPHGKGELNVPSGAHGDREDLALERTEVTGGFPFAPTGDPMADGVGPASWSPREDAPELDAHGNPKIQPMAGKEAFFVSAGRDPRGMPVLSRDDLVVGHVTDMWIDEGEALVRYLQVDLEAEHGGGTKLIPITMAKIAAKWVKVNSLSARHFAGIPGPAAGDRITKLEEEKNNAWFAGGTMYSPGEYKVKKSALARAFSGD